MQRRVAPHIPGQIYPAAKLNGERINASEYLLLVAQPHGLTNSRDSLQSLRTPGVGRFLLKGLVCLWQFYKEPQDKQ
jgi:hypothetical protein